jgi:hypothetical protein
MGHLHEFLNRPDVIRDPAFHCWPDFQRSMNAAKSIEREMQRQRSFQIIPLLRKRTRQLVSRRIVIRIVKFCRSTKDVLMWLGSGSPVRVFSTHDTLKVIERDGIAN